MRYAEANSRLRQLLREAGLTAEALDPWETWKVFKAFLREPVRDAADDGLVQFGVYTDEGNVDRVHLCLVRQFAELELFASDDAEGPFSHLICDLAYDSGVLGPPEGVKEREIWTMDAPSLESFIDRVEGCAEFQTLMNAVPVATAIYAEEA